jgi:hypothetical protein
MHPPEINYPGRGQSGRSGADGVKGCFLATAPSGVHGQKQT